MSNVFTALERLCVGGQPTTVLNPAGDSTLPVSASFEVTGTEGALLLPRLTTDQMNALDNTNSTVAAGMQVYNTDENAVMDYIYTNQWVKETQSEQFLEARHTLSYLNVRAMRNTPIQLIAAPNADEIISIQQMSFYFHAVESTPVLFTLGGNITVSYGAAPTAPLLAVVKAIDNTIASTVITTNSNPSVTINWGVENTLLAKVGTRGLGVYISNLTQPFQEGFGLQVRINIIYNIVTT